MTRTQTTQIRRTTICVATAVAISLPSVASAGIFDKAKSRAQTARANATTVVNIVREKKPIATAFQNATENLPGAELVDMVRQLHLKEQLQNTIALLQQMQADYQHFSGGGFGCEGPCATFRTEFKDIFDTFLSLAEEVPVLSERTWLIDNIDRLQNLIDYVPPRALYHMWQALGDQVQELQTTAGEIRRGLDALPPFEGLGVVAAASGAVADSRVCEWANRSDKPVVEWLQVKLEIVAWSLKTIAEVIPDVEIKAEAGAEAGAAVANVTGAAGAGVKPTDAVKSALKIVAAVPEGINLGIKLRIARMKMACASATFVSDQLAAN